MAADLRRGAQSAVMANGHAMARPGQTPAQAADEFVKYVSEQIASGTASGLGNAEHAVQDAFAPAHSFDKEWDGSFDGWRDFVHHTWTDLLPGYDAIRKAINATKELIRTMGCRKC
jgi:hypothetical protein